MSFKDDMYNKVVRGNEDIRYEYERYVQEHIEEHYTNRVRQWKILANLNYHYRVKKATTPLLYWDRGMKKSIEKIEKPKVIDTKQEDVKVDNNHNSEKLEANSGAQKLYYENKDERTPVNNLIASLMEYDVVSFDIFDTLIYRKVEKPNDVFNIMSAEMGLNDFIDIRKKAEAFARSIKEKKCGTREIVLSDIYDILNERFDIDRKWMDREIELEIQLSMANEYIKKVYDALILFGKTIVFTTDMYLPLDVIKRIVEKNGYTQYEEIILSNEYAARKGDGTLQLKLIEKYPEKRIVHIGDNYDADVNKSIESGIDAIYNPDSHFTYREPELDNLAGSVYRAVIQNNMNNGLWDKDIYYSHGFRVGGLLTVGYCQYINRLVQEKNIDKVLFCSRDGFIINEVYNKFFKEVETEYIKISRYAIFSITAEHYLYDFSNRYIMKYMKMYAGSKTVETILKETGFGFLVEECADNNINPYMFPSTIHDFNRIQEFIYKCMPQIVDHFRPAREAAKKYYREVIGNAKNILIVDIGWSGTCITALKYFLNKHFSELDLNITGALMCTNRNDLIKNSIQFNEISAYLNSPFENMDITRHIFPGPPRSRNVKEMDILHMPFEYLYTSTDHSLLSYELDDNGDYTFKYSNNNVDNAEQINRMHLGVMDFAKTYVEYLESIKAKVFIPPYTAFTPIREAINHKEYIYDVFKDYVYDAQTQAESTVAAPCFESLFDFNDENQTGIKLQSRNGKNILFVTPELIYSGAPRSMLRMCRVAKLLGYGVEIWSAKEGPFRKEYEAEGFEVKIIPENTIIKHLNDIEKFDMAICNTVVTSKYAEECCRRIPTVWYIREATNIPDFIRNNDARAYTIKHSKDIYVVSDYAADALSLYADEPITVVHNCVEDEVEMASDYVVGSSEKVKFVQFGTMEYRKGYDVLIAAYESMPKEYREKSELFFAGGFIASGAPFCDYIFDKINKTDGVNYLGLIQGEEKKIDTLSQMDVVVVASRDESCSLVALEGAMLSKPLIVTENVGAKYMVSDDNGLIVNTDDVNSLKEAMMTMIDNKNQLVDMGKASRRLYEEKASMKAYTKSMREVFSLCEKKNTDEFEAEKKRNNVVFCTNHKLTHPIRTDKTDEELRALDDIAVVSLTSHPGRMNVIEKCIDSLLNQTVKPKKIVLALSKEQFPNKENDLPYDLVSKSYISEYFDILWVDDDLKPHKKYYYAMKKYPDNPVIIVDDDVIYDKHLVENLVESYIRFPECISAMRTNLMGFKKDGTLMDYEGWIMGYRAIQDTPSSLLMPTGVGGVLYPPHCLPDEAFDIDAIKENCLYCDDIWLKIWASHAGIKVVMPEHFCLETLIDGSQDVALWRMNVRQGNNNDYSTEKTLAYYDKITHAKDKLLSWIRKDRFC